MFKSVRIHALLVILLIAGCGEGAEDELTLSFLRFTEDGITQADRIVGTAAEVDVCQGLCVASLEAETFTQTGVNAVFENLGQSDIFLDSYTINVRGSGVPPVTRAIGVLLQGRATTSVGLLLYDFDFKQRVVLGQCPRYFQDPETGEILVDFGNVVDQVLSTNITFSGVDDSNERFTVAADLVSTFTNFNNCN